MPCIKNMIGNNCVDDFLMKDSARQGDKREQLLQELRTREQELEFTLTKQREVYIRLFINPEPLEHLA